MRKRGFSSICWLLPQGRPANLRAWANLLRGLVHRLARQLGGRLERVGSSDGTRWELDLPLP
jgi:hypothetical protein